MTDTVHAQPTAGPPPGWYPDPGGSSAQRWWNGAGWTEALQPVVAPIAAHVPVPAPVPTVAPAPVNVAVQPAEVPFGTPRVPAAGHARLHASPTAASGSGVSGKAIAFIVAAIVVLAALGLLALKLTSGGGDDATGLVPTGVHASVPVTPAQATVISDSISVATAEETVFADSQGYVGVHAPSSRLVLNGQVVPLSKGNTATIWLASTGEAFCTRVVGPSGVAVYISDRGGRQAPAVTTCPASYAS